MDPTRTIHTPLLSEVKSLSRLKGAWDHVRSQALKSRDPATKRERTLIETDTLKYLRAVQRQLGSGEFIFEKQKGVLKKREGKNPRPIVVSPLRNRIVQRAILDVCQSDRPRIQRRLGNLPSTISTPTSVGGLPRRGVSSAICLIKKAIEDGATHYVRSDLVNFFGNLPKRNLHQFLDAEVTDAAFVSLFKASLDVDLENADQTNIQQWWELFPSEDTGVPQGSALSAISANIILSEFDKRLNVGGITCVRYLDDFLILGNSEHAVGTAWAEAERILGRLKLKAHQPGQSSKAGRGRIDEGFDFLSFSVKGNTIAPTRESKSKLLSEVDEVLREARKEIQISSGDPRRSERRFIQTLELVDRKIRGWGDSFKASTQRLEFIQLDARLSERIDGFVGWFLRIQNVNSVSARRRMWGVALLADTPRF